MIYIQTLANDYKYFDTDLLTTTELDQSSCRNQRRIQIRTFPVVK